MFRSGFVSVLGRPNVGKSTLLNRFLGAKIAATSDKPQTTRRRVVGIHTDSVCQIVFVDTPGMHKPRDLLNRFMIQEIDRATEDTNLAVILIEAHQPIGKGDQFLCRYAREKSIPTLLAINKVDLASPRQTESRRVEAEPLFPRESMFLISATDGTGCDLLFDRIRESLPEGPQYYPEDQLSDQTERFAASEFIREAVLEHTRQEIPHAIAVAIDEWKDRDPGEGKTVIKAIIYVEQESQKGIVIGAKGSCLRKVGSKARGDIEELIAKPVYLDLWVKVRKKWRKDSKSLREFGYSA